MAFYCVLKAYRITSFSTVTNSATSVTSNDKNIDVRKVKILTLALYNDKKANYTFILKLSIPCILAQCICLLYQPIAQYQIRINSKDTTLTCCGKNILSPGSTCKYYFTLCSWC